MSLPSAPTFAPPEEAIDGLLANLARPDFSFLDLAARHHTTPEALSLWMAKPDIRERLAASADIITWRTQYVATIQLSAAVAVLSNICTTYSAENRASQPAPIPGGFSDSPSNPAPPAPASGPSAATDPILKLRRAESARRAATTLIRLTTLRPLGAPTISSPTNRATDASRPTTASRATGLQGSASTPARPCEDYPVSPPTPSAPRASPAHPTSSDHTVLSTCLPTPPTIFPLSDLSFPHRPNSRPQRRPRSTSSLLDLVGASTGPP